MQQQIDGYSLQDSPVHLLRLSLQRMTELFAVQLGETDLTLRQFMLLVAAHQHPSSTQTDLVALTGIDRSTVGDMLDRLEKRELIRRERSGRDQRANSIQVQDAGVAVIESALPAARQAEAELLATVPVEQRVAVIHLLRRIANVPDPIMGGQPMERRAVASPPT